MFLAMAHSPAALEAFMTSINALENHSELDEKTFRQVVLAVSESNGSSYCVAANVALAKASGLSENQITDARRGRSTESRVDAALKFALELMETHGRIPDEDLTRLRRAGFTETEIVEISVLVGTTTMANIFTNVAQTEIDFPAAFPLPEVTL
jgi:AhpD family alkylhydroperoxidase